MDAVWTDEAKETWEAIPMETRKKILKNVWCSACRTITTITGYWGRIEGESLILTGLCTRCRGKVARVLEGHEKP